MVSPAGRADLSGDTAIVLDYADKWDLLASRWSPRSTDCLMVSDDQVLLPIDAVGRVKGLGVTITPLSPKSHRANI